MTIDDVSERIVTFDFFKLSPKRLILGAASLSSWSIPVLKTRMSYSGSICKPCVSVSYGTIDIGLFLQEGKEIKYSSFERASHVIKQMPDSKRRTLLAPIEQGLIDPQSVFFLIDDKNEGQIAICVEDFVQLANNCFLSKEKRLRQQKNVHLIARIAEESHTDPSTIPPRLLDALLLLSDDEEYSSIDDDSLRDDQIDYRVMLATVLAFGVVFHFFNSETKHSSIETTITTPFPKSYETYDCVNGSITTVLFADSMIPLVDLNLPRKSPTLITEQSHEYLFVNNKTQWWYALKYCTAWCGYLVAINTRKENDFVLDMVTRQRTEQTNYWIGLKGWKNDWYLDDESSITFFNFPDLEEAYQEITDIDGIIEGCVQAGVKGIWSVIDCREPHPFVCERNTADKDIRRTPFHPHQDIKCALVGGMCKYGAECVDGFIKNSLCPFQAKNIVCCVPNNPKPQRLTNSSIHTCAEAGGICNHVDGDQCRNGRVVYDLMKPCPDHPRKLDCCVENDI